jgi:hypothetical protein
MTNFSLRFHAFYRFPANSLYPRRNHTGMARWQVQASFLDHQVSDRRHVPHLAATSTIEFIGAFVDASCSPWPTRFAGTTCRPSSEASHVSRSAAVSTGYIRGNIQERTMEFISTTATAAEKLKRLAKTLRKTTGTSLAVALDAVAKQHGYEHWKHVTVCIDQTANVSRSKPLPDSLKDLLDRTAARHPASAESQKAFAQGFVFAMDVKDAEDLSLTSEYAECDDGWYLAARDLWRGLVHYRDDETGTTLFETKSPEDLASTALDDLQNYRLFRYLGTGAAAPTSLEEAYKHTRQLSFFPPTHIWIGGRFIDMGEVPELQMDGKVVFSTTPGFAVLPSDGKRSRP